MLTPFLIGAVLAYALQPLVERLARARRAAGAGGVGRRDRRLIVVVLAVVLLIVPILSKQLPLLREQIPLLADASTQARALARAFGIDVALDTASIKAFVLKYLDANLDEWLVTAMNSARIGGSILLALVGNLVLMPVVLFYLLMDWKHLVARAARTGPAAPRAKVDGFTAESDRCSASTCAASCW